MFLEEFHHPCSESGDDDPNHKPRDTECGKEQNETTIVQPRCGNGDRECLAYEEHRSVVLEYRIVMAELVDCVSMPYRERPGSWSTARGRTWSPVRPTRPSTHGRQQSLNWPELSTELLYTLANSPYRMSADYRVIIGDSRRMSEVTDESVHLTVTSPPYPMVSIWDDFFAEASAPSYNKMHEYLNE